MFICISISLLIGILIPCIIYAFWRRTKSFSRHKCSPPIPKTGMDLVKSLQEAKIKTRDNNIHFGSPPILDTGKISKG